MSFSLSSRLRALRRPMLARAWCALVGFRLALWTISFPRLQRVARTSRAPRRALNRPGAATPALVASAIESASRFVPGSTCLVRALAAQFLLRRDWKSELHVGVVKSPDGALLAHAWLECDGVVIVGGGESERYTPILRSAAP